MNSKSGAASHVENELRTTYKPQLANRPLDTTRSKATIPNGPNPPPRPPLKNRLNNSSGDISSSKAAPPRGKPPPPNPPPKGDAPAGPALGWNLLSGSPPNLSYLDLLSESDRTWKARDTTNHTPSSDSKFHKSTIIHHINSLLNASSAPSYPFLSGCVTKLSFRYAFLISPSVAVFSTDKIS